MTSPKKDNIIIAEHGIITQDALLAYLNDELSVEQKQELDSLLKLDPFAQDALEGLRNTQDKAGINSSLVSIRRKVNERIGGKKEKRVITMHWSNYAYAAVILGLLISVGFIITAYFNGKQKDTIAMNAKSEQTVAEPQKTEEVKPAAPAGSSGMVTDSVAIIPSANGSVITTTVTMTDATNTTTQKQVAKAETDRDDKVLKQELARKKVKDTVSFKNVTVSGNSNGLTANSYGYSSNATTNNNVSNKGQMTSTGLAANESIASERSNFAEGKKAKPETKEKADVTADEEDATMAGAKKTFFNGDYKKSAVEFDEILKKHPDNAQALFFGGVSKYVNGDLDESEKNFDKILTKGHKFTDGAKWYKASILLKRGNKDGAKNLLQELSHTKGSYKERAEKKLTELQ